MTDPARPDLSVVVTVVDGGAALARCLSALAAQPGAPALEVLVPCDDTAASSATIARGFPGVRVLDMGAVLTEHPCATAAGQHELFDRRRAAGLAAASGALVAIVEDRGVPEPDWAAAMADLHRRLPHAVIGGAVAPGKSGAWLRAAFLCDYARYAPPFAEGPRDFVTDVNVCYKRRALEATRALWQQRYHETTVHWALRRAGETLHLSPAPVVRQVRDDRGTGALLAERFAWGRLFAVTRARESTPAQRLVRTATSPLLPFVMWWRILRGAAGRGESGGVLLLTPILFVLLAGWAAGEAAGYLTARA